MHSTELQDLLGTEVLGLARGSIEHGLVNNQPLPVELGKLPRQLSDLAATFTTLRLEGELRGCCGALEAALPLAKDVALSAFQAAFNDPRFDPVVEGEVNDVVLEVAVLSPLEPIVAASEAELLGHLRPGIDGLVIDAGLRRATFLPKVWESIPEPPRFLAALKKKCGLAENYWSEQLEFHRYRTTSYAETAQ